MIFESKRYARVKDKSYCMNCGEYKLCKPVITSLGKLNLCFNCRQKYKGAVHID